MSDGVCFVASASAATHREPESLHVQIRKPQGGVNSIDPALRLTKLERKTTAGASSPVYLLCHPEKLSPGGELTRTFIDSSHIQAQAYRDWRVAEEMKGVTWKPQLSQKSLSLKEDSESREPPWMRLSRVPASSSKVNPFYCSSKGLFS